MLVISLPDNGPLDPFESMTIYHAADIAELENAYVLMSCKFALLWLTDS